MCFIIAIGEDVFDEMFPESYFLMVAWTARGERESRLSFRHLVMGSVNHRSRKTEKYPRNFIRWLRSLRDIIDSHSPSCVLIELYFPSVVREMLCNLSVLTPFPNLPIFHRGNILLELFVIERA